MFEKGSDRSSDLRAANTSPRFRHTMWANAFYGACAALMVAPGVSMAQSVPYLTEEVQELRDEVRALKAQVNAQPAHSQTAAPTTTQAAADDGVPVTAKGATLNLGGLKLTLGGFIAAESVWRARNETSDINSSFRDYPFRNAPGYYETELRESARQSRVQLLAQGPNDGVNKVEAFIASDFLSSGTTSNQNQSNSYTLRLREGYFDWARTDLDMYVLAGQTWSLATLYKKGLTPRSEDIPLTIDAQYVVGFTWLRTPQLRVVKNFGSLVAVGVSLENPQNLVRGTAPAGATAVTTGDNGGLLNNTVTSYSTDIAPDITVKAAVDPGFGHYELFGLTRFFRDRSESTPGTITSTTNHTTVAASIGGGMILPVIPKLLDFQASGLVGHGNERYASAQLGDSTYKTSDGSITALKSESLLLGLIGHPTPRFDIYTYAGVERLGSAYGFGNGHGDNSACNVNAVNVGTLPKVNGAAAACSTSYSSEREITGGFWWKTYKGSIGYVQTGAQFEYAKLRTFTDATGHQGSTDDTTVLLSFRYYPYQ